MNKQELVAAVAESTGLPRGDAARAVEAVLEAVTTTLDTTLAREVTDLVGDADSLTFANYNMENLDAAEESTDGSFDRFDQLAADIVNNLRSPDIIAAQELQDADGPGGGSDLTAVATANAALYVCVASAWVGK